MYAAAGWPWRQERTLEIEKGSATSQSVENSFGISYGPVLTHTTEELINHVYGYKQTIHIRYLGLPVKLQAQTHLRQFNLLKPTGHVMHQQFNIQQLYVLPAVYLCVLYLSENKQRLVSLTA